MTTMIQRIEIFDVEEAGALLLDLREVLEFVERRRYANRSCSPKPCPLEADARNRARSGYN